MSNDQFVKSVLKFWRENGRHGLPWRKTHDPYKILVSEIMLQQTQVDRVIPYFNRWIKKFPTMRALAKAPLNNVLKVWSGLGYNRRAILLRECAKVVVAKYGGRMPKTREKLEALQAVGPYTAGAIRAFAFNEPDIFIETNIRAALIHHFYPRSRKVPDAKLTVILKDLLANVKSSREWYSALMDYGTYIKHMHTNPSRRSKHHVRQAPFEGSLRQVRGAILRKLLEGPVSEMALQRIDAKNIFHVSMALRAMSKEGFIEKRRNRWHLSK